MIEDYLPGTVLVPSGGMLALCTRARLPASDKSEATLSSLLNQSTGYRRASSKSVYLSPPVIFI
jgi:hypothetical protein